jgi:hypothetical protein
VKKYTVTQHAIKRAVERLEITAEHAANHLLQLMQTAYYNGDTPNHHGKIANVYDHHKTRTRIIVEDNKIVTVYKVPELDAPKQTVFIDDIKRLVARKFTKAKRQFTKQRRSLEIELAELNIEVARLRLNQAKARSPKVQSSIQTKVDELMTQVSRIESEIKKACEQFSEIQRGAEAYL